MCYKGDVSILVRMEQTVLKLLNFEMQVADPVFFLSRLMLYDENGKNEEVNIFYLFISFNHFLNYLILF